MKTTDTPIVLASREPAVPSGGSAAGALPFEVMLCVQPSVGVPLEVPGADRCDELGERPEDHTTAEEATANEAAAAQAMIVAMEPLLVLPPERIAIDPQASLPSIDSGAADSAPRVSADGTESPTWSPEWDATPEAHAAATGQFAHRIESDLAFSSRDAAAAGPRAVITPSSVELAAGGQTNESATAGADSGNLSTLDPHLTALPEVQPLEANEPPATTNTPSVSAVNQANDASRALERIHAANEPMGGRAAPPAHIDSPRLLSRVARAFHLAQRRGGELTLRLSPPELGSLRVELHVEDGAMTARLEAETEVARTALIEHLPVLRERLAEQGVRVERFDVDLMQQRGQETGGREQRPEWERGREGERERGRIPGPRVEQTLPLTPSPPHLTPSAGLNVVI